MARYVAASNINNNGVLIEAGAPLVGIPDDLLAHWVENGTAEVLENMEPSLRDTQEAWAAYAVEQGALTEEDAAGLTKEQLVQTFMGMDDEAGTEPETGDGTSDEDDPEDDDSDETSEAAASDDGPYAGATEATVEPNGGEEA